MAERQGCLSRHSATEAGVSFRPVPIVPSRLGSSINTDIRIPYSAKSTAGDTVSLDLTTNWPVVFTKFCRKTRSARLSTDHRHTHSIRRVIIAGDTVSLHLTTNWPVAIDGFCQATGSMLLLGSPDERRHTRPYSARSTAGARLVLTLPRTGR